MKCFWLELKSYCKSIKFLALILVLLSFQAMLVTRFDEEKFGAHIRETRVCERYSSENNSWVDYWQTRYDYLQEHGRPNPIDPYSAQMIEYNLNWYGYEKVLGNNIYEAYRNEDWSTYNRYMAEKRLVEWSIHEMSHRAFHDYSNPNIKPVPRPEQYFGNGWSKYSTLVNDPELKMLPLHWDERMKAALSSNPTILETAYYLELVDKNLPPKGPQDITPWGFLFNFLRRGLPNILGLIVLLMTVNILHRDKKFGSIKSTLQVPKGRIFYLTRKVLVGFVSSIFVVIIPMAMMFLGLGIKHGYRGLNFPVLINTNFLERVVSQDYIMYILRDTPLYQVGLSQYQLPWNIFIPALDHLEFIPLWQFLALSTVFLALFILFCAVLGVLISVLVKNEVLAQIMAVVVFGLGTAITMFFPKLSSTPWDLFSKAHVIPILEGTHYSTFLGSMISLGIASIVLFGLSAILFKKQDIIA